MDSCKTCKFFMPLRHYTDGFCRRYPPVPLLSNDPTEEYKDECYWPHISEDVWCGEWELKQVYSHEQEERDKKAT